MSLKLVKIHFHVIPNVIHSGQQNAWIFYKSHQFQKPIILSSNVDTLRKSMLCLVIQAEQKLNTSYHLIRTRMCLNLEISHNTVRAGLTRVIVSTCHSFQQHLAFFKDQINIKGGNTSLKFMIFIYLQFSLKKPSCFTGMFVSIYNKRAHTFSRSFYLTTLSRWFNFVDGPGMNFLKFIADNQSKIPAMGKIYYSIILT